MASVICELWNAPVDLDSEISAPTYEQTVATIVEPAFARLGPFRAKRDLSEPHHGLRRVLRSETNRAEKFKESDWSFYKPHFSEPRFQRQLRIFSSIFFILDSIRAVCDVVARETWIQGIGHIHHLIARISIGASSVQLQILEPENPKGNSDGRQDYLNWSEAALAEANGMDPMHQPVHRCFIAWKASALD